MIGILLIFEPPSLHLIETWNPLEVVRFLRFLVLLHLHGSVVARLGEAEVVVHNARRANGVIVAAAAGSMEMLLLFVAVVVVLLLLLLLL